MSMYFKLQLFLMIVYLIPLYSKKIRYSVNEKSVKGKSNWSYTAGFRMMEDSILVYSFVKALRSKEILRMYAILRVCSFSRPYTSGRQIE